MVDKYLHAKVKDLEERIDKLEKALKEKANKDHTHSQFHNPPVIGRTLGNKED
jgi:phosphopantetheine adenylyltransferase